LPTVLIADDYAAARSAIRARFENYSGFIVCGEAVDGADAIEKALKLHPDLILLDLAMPNLNGVEAASVLKGLQPRMKIIVFTMYAEALGRSLAAAVGIDAVLAKSYGIAKVVECIRSLFGQDAIGKRSG
jgi:DNA-binding NarL/FixJ family response regulator